MASKKQVFSLFLTMMKIGLFTFGGGYAMLALLEDEFVSRRAWVDKEEFLHMVALAESTPGPIAINAATYLGYKLAGVVGAVTATVAVCIPSFVIVYAISLFFDAFLSLVLVAYAFRGIQVCVVYLILSAGMRMLKSVEHRPLPMIILGAVMAAMVFFTLTAVEFSSVWYILFSAAVGLIAYAVTCVRREVER